MYEVSQGFRTAMEAGATQHIKGVLTLTSGVEITLNDDTILGEPDIESQCVENREVFNFGGLYAGKLSITLILSLHTDVVVGGIISLDFSVEGYQSGANEEWVPLGVWDVKKADRQNENILSVEAMDRIDRLNYPMDADTSSPITMAKAMQRITELTGVEFAQDIDDLQAFIDYPNLSINGYGFGYAKTCRDEVRMISQIIGGFAFANREGQIEFRQFGNYYTIGRLRVYYSVLTIPATKRFSAKLSEHGFRVHSVTYTNDYGLSATAVLNPDGAFMGDLGYSKNRYIWSNNRDGYAQAGMLEYLESVDVALENLIWVPGRIEWYGDPTLDLGDQVLLTGGVAGEQRPLIITDMTWRFRGRQTLGSAGAGTATTSGGGSSSSGSSATSSVNITNNVTLKVNTVDLTPYLGEVFASERTVADGRFSCKGQTTAFIDVTMILLGTEDATLAAAVHLNQIAQTVRPKITIHDGEYQTLHFNVPVIVSGGKNSVAVVLAGACEVVDVQAYVWGQELTAEAPDPTLESDYTYTISNSQTTVTGYIGSSLSPKIPSYFEGAPTVIIGSESFTESEIQSVYIPDGVTRIE